MSGGQDYDERCENCGLTFGAHRAGPPGARGMCPQYQGHMDWPPGGELFEPSGVIEVVPIGSPANKNWRAAAVAARFARPSTTSEWFTASGGYVLQMDAGKVSGYPMRFACTAGDDDMGVVLDAVECVRLGGWLLSQAMSLDEVGILRGLIKLAEHRLGADMPYAPPDGLSNGLDNEGVPF